MFAFLFNNSFKEPKTMQIEPAKTHCFMAFYTPGNKPYPIQKLLDGKLNGRIAEEFTGYFGCKFYSTQEEAGQSLFDKTRTGNLKAAYIIELGVDSEQAKHFIQEKKYHLIIIKAVNYKDLQKKIIVPEHEIEVIANSNFNKKISLESAVAPSNYLAKHTVLMENNLKYSHIYDCNLTY